MIALLYQTTSEAQVAAITLPSQSILKLGNGTTLMIALSPRFKMPKVE